MVSKIVKTQVKWHHKPKPEPIGKVNGIGGDVVQVELKREFVKKLDSLGASVDQLIRILSN